MRKLICVLAACMAVGLIAAGCGGDDETTTTSAGASGASGATGEQGALTKAAFLKQGNAICAKGNKELDSAFNSLGKNASQADQEKVVTDTVVPNIQGQIDDIDAFTPPKGDEGEVQSIVDSAEAALGKIKADPSLLTEQGGSDPFAEVNKKLKAYGLNVCAG